MNGLVFLRLKEITHLEADGNYTIFSTAGGERYTVTRLLKEYEELLPQTVFYRCHQSHIVNLHFIKRFIKEDGGQVQLENGELVAVSRRRKDALVELLVSGGR